MLVVKTKLKEMPGKGIGLVADQKIAKGQTTCVYHPLIDIKVYKKDIPNEAHDFFDTYAVDIGEDYLILSIDNTRFTNHSDNPSTKSLGRIEGRFQNNIATRDIEIGEEITIDYNQIDVGGATFAN